MHSWQTDVARAGATLGCGVGAGDAGQGRTWGGPNHLCHVGSGPQGIRSIGSPGAAPSPSRPSSDYQPILLPKICMRPLRV